MTRSGWGRLVRETGVHCVPEGHEVRGYGMLHRASPFTTTVKAPLPYLLRPPMVTSAALFLLQDIFKRSKTIAKMADAYQIDSSATHERNLSIQMFDPAAVKLDAEVGAGQQGRCIKQIDG